MMSATTWPEPAAELVCAWQPDRPLAQVALVVDTPSGGPRAPLPSVTAVGPSLPAAEVRAVPVHGVPAAQSSVAEAIVQLDAPGTVGPPEFADDPGATGAGTVAGSCGCSAGACPPVVSEVTVAFAVDRCATSGAMVFASCPVDEPELVTAWHTAPDTPSHDPSLREPRASGDTAGSTALAELVTFPVQVTAPSQVIAAPAADAADGPAGIRAAFTGCDCPASATAAPGPEEALDTDRTSHPPVAPVQDAVPSEVRGAPFATAPSHAAVPVRTEPVHAVPAAHTTDPLALDVDEGPLAGWPATGRPVFGSTTA
jgi:hypothetical protein